MIILPIFFLSLFMLKRNEQTIQEHEFLSIQEKVNLTSSTLTKVIEQIYYTCADMAEQSNIKKLAHDNIGMTVYEESKNIIQIQNQQTSIKNANQYISQIIIYYKDMGKAYVNSDGIRASYFEFSPEEYTELSQKKRFPNFLVLHDQTMMEIIHPSADYDFFIRVDLSEETISSLMKNAFTGYQFYYLLDSFDHAYQITNLNEEQMEALTMDEDGKYWINGKEYYQFSEPMPYGDSQISYFFPEEQLFSGTRMYQSLNSFFYLYVVFASCLFMLCSYLIIQRPMQTMIQALQDIRRQDYSVRIESKSNSDFDYLYNEFNRMAKQLEELIEKDYKQQLSLNRAELKQLQAQINPHFLYNSFFLMRRMMQDELYEEAQKMADTLGMYFQYVTRNSQEFMSLYQEYRHAQLYCEIQQLRFEGRILIEMDTLPVEYSTLQVPKLILQPILENAFNYGLHNKVENGIIKVTIKEDCSGVVVIVEDNGEELTDQKLIELQEKLSLAVGRDFRQETTGLLNIQRRLHIYSGGESYLVVERSTLGGLCLKVHLVNRDNNRRIAMAEGELHDKDTVGG